MTCHHYVGLTLLAAAIIGWACSRRAGRIDQLVEAEFEARTSPAGSPEHVQSLRKAGAI